jgi:uncharacterized protein (DUF58 family)
VLERLRRRPPIWPAVGLALFIALWAISTIYLALALALCVSLLLLAYWAWHKLPDLYAHDRDSADKESEKRGREIAAKRRRSR